MGECMTDYSSLEFEKQYTYEGDDLGAVVTKEGVNFRVYVPLASEVYLNLYKSGNAKRHDRINKVKMQRSENGTFKLELKGDYTGLFYTYTVIDNKKKREANDPYARAVGINGDRACIVDLSTTNPYGWEKDVNPNKDRSIVDAIIYEAHIRDLTSEPGSGINHIGKYLGVAECLTGTKNGVKTGLSHMKELGITHLHILPFFDFASINEKKKKPAYNWGYDPKNFNAFEGSYSLNPYDPSMRIREVKTMIKALHDNGISVIMDVVYNHVDDAVNFSYNRLMPGFFSRIDKEGKLSNGSGCGNDTASERNMVRKFIVDSVYYLATEFHIDGFRFDLVGLLDVDTINAIVKKVSEKRKDVFFYGEGWDIKTEVSKEIPLAIQKNACLTPSFAYFNDSIRDGLRGSVFSDVPGFVSGARDMDEIVSKCFLGKEDWCISPCQTINYASCHDNHTLFDRICLSRPDASLKEHIAMNNLAASIYLLSQGVPFMQAGEELLRSKKNPDGSFNDNTYKSGDRINMIKYSSLEDENVRKVYEYYKGLISFRKEHEVFRKKTFEEVDKAVSLVPVKMEGVLSFALKEGDKDIFAVFNSNPYEVLIELPKGEWDVYIDKEKAGTNALYTLKGNVSVNEISAFVAIKK